MHAAKTAVLYNDVTRRCALVQAVGRLVESKQTVNKNDSAASRRRAKNRDRRRILVVIRGGELTGQQS